MISIIIRDDATVFTVIYGFCHKQWTFDDKYSALLFRQILMKHSKKLLKHGNAAFSLETMCYWNFVWQPFSYEIQRILNVHSDEPIQNQALNYLRLQYKVTFWTKAPVEFISAYWESIKNSFTPKEFHLKFGFENSDEQFHCEFVKS